jgi:hypothetical protein
MATLGFESNIEDVIDSVDEVADDLISKFKKIMERQMSFLENRASQYVSKDASYRGNLMKSLHTESDATPPEMTFKVATDPKIAPYAAIVEYGSGQRTNDEWQGSETAPPPDTGSAVPRDFPYESPDIDTPSEENKYQLAGYPSYAGFVGYIEDWMERKPVEPRSGNLFTSAVAIAWEIANKGNLAHPFMRPAWFDQELQIKKAVKSAFWEATR